MSKDEYRFSETGTHVMRDSMRARLLLVEQLELVRTALRTLLELIPYIDRVEEAVDGREAFRAVQADHYDIVVADVDFPDSCDIEAVRRIIEVAPHTRVLALSTHANEFFVAEALRAGASGYLLKDGATSELDLALKAILRGARYLTPIVAEEIVQAISRIDVDSGSEPGIWGLLTPRQSSVLRLIAEGRRRGEIAAHLGISVKTVETHRTRIMERFGISDTKELTRFIIRAGFAA